MATDWSEEEPYKPVIEIMDAALEAMEPQTVGLVSNFMTPTNRSKRAGNE